MNYSKHSAQKAAIAAAPGRDSGLLQVCLQPCTSDHSSPTLYFPGGMTSLSHHPFTLIASTIGDLKGTKTQKMSNCFGITSKHTRDNNFLRDFRHAHFLLSFWTWVNLITSQVLEGSTLWQCPAEPGGAHCNPSTWEVEAGGFGAQGHPCLASLRPTCVS